MPTPATPLLDGAGAPPPGVVLRAPSPDAEVFCPPSPEALRLLRLAPRLVSPAEGLGAGPARWAREVLVAPFTQLTFVSFDLQMFLFDVLHVSWVARAGHLVGMTGVNLFAMALAAAAAGPWGAVAYGALLLGWYLAVARTQGLWLWWAVMVPIVAALGAGGAWLAANLAVGALVAGVVGAGFVVTLSHAGEALYPPRAGDPYRWTPLREHVFGAADAPIPAATTLRRVLRMSAYATVIGLCDELWASPRLLPYNVLRLLLAAGYAPALKRTLDDRARRALASGNPALDYVGIGGGTFMGPAPR